MGPRVLFRIGFRESPIQNMLWKKALYAFGEAALLSSGGLLLLGELPYASGPAMFSLLHGVIKHVGGRQSGTWARHLYRRSTSVASCRWLCCAADPTLTQSILRIVAAAAALPGDSLDVLLNKNADLRAKLKFMAWPRLTRMEVSGKTYTLPWRCKDKLSRNLEAVPREDELRYLAGFFDGDGCIRSSGPHFSSCRLEVAQSYDGAEVLLKFQSAFGGTIARLRNGIGLRKPVLRWSLYGPSARLAAESLAAHSIVKRRQLEMAYIWPQEQAARRSWNQELVSLKHRDSAVPSMPSWEYFTGFFDAEGSITVKHSSSLQLTLCQKHATVIECLLAFLASRVGLHAGVWEQPGFYYLNICSTSVSKQLLTSMLDSGMIRKREAAKLAMKLTTTNTSQVRASLAKLSGNQMFGKRLDQAGEERAAKISSLQRNAGSARRKGNLEQATVLLQEVEILKREHALLKAQTENHELQQYIHRVLNVLWMGMLEKQVQAQGGGKEAERNLEWLHSEVCETVSFPINCTLQLSGPHSVCKRS